MERSTQTEPALLPSNASSSRSTVNDDVEAQQFQEKTGKDSTLVQWDGPNDPVCATVPLIMALQFIPTRSRTTQPISRPLANGPSP
jgi:hypothetical protein